MPARTIRFYQAERLLPKPDHDPHRRPGGARYAAHHAETLDLIGRLRDRGLKLPAIRELLREGNSSERVAEWLGLDATLRGAWAPRTSRVMGQAELDEFFEDCPPGTTGLFQRHLLQRMGDGWIMVHADLADLTVAIVRGGVEPELVLDAGDILREHLSKAADQLMNLFADAWSSGFGSGSTAEATVATLRPVAGDAGPVDLRQRAGTIKPGPSAADTKRLTRR